MLISNWISCIGESGIQEGQNENKVDQPVLDRSVSIEFQPYTIEDDRNEKSSPFKEQLQSEERFKESTKDQVTGWEDLEKRDSESSVSKPIDYQFPTGMQPITKDDAKEYRTHEGDLYANENPETLLNAKIVMSGMINEMAKDV